MSNIDDLFEKYHEGWLSVASRTDGDRQSAGRAGIRSVVMALRDEMCSRIGSIQSVAEAWDMFEGILGIDAGEKVGGSAKRADEHETTPPHRPCAWCV